MKFLFERLQQLLEFRTRDSLVSSLELISLMLKYPLDFCASSDVLKTSKNGPTYNTIVDAGAILLGIVQASPLLYQKNTTHTSPMILNPTLYYRTIKCLSSMREISQSSFGISTNEDVQSQHDTVKCRVAESQHRVNRKL